MRAQNAERTRRAILRAATALFTADGYDATSLSAIADEADVARPTVAAVFGSKPALLAQVLDVALAGDDQPGPVAERPWFAPVWQAQTQGQVLDAYAGVCVIVAGRAAAVFEAVRRASDSAPEVAALWESSLHNRRLGAAMIVDRLAGLGDWRPGVNARRATDILWTLNDPGLYAALVDGCGWPPADYRRWLAETMRRQLLVDPDDPIRPIDQG